jgi:predicted metal-binding protein
MAEHIMFVCTSCASAHRTKQPLRKSGGERLLEKLQTMHQVEPLEDFSIQPQDCLGACDRDCVIAFHAPGKYIHLFGDLLVDDEQLEPTASAVMQFAHQYQAKSDGIISYLKCPAILKKRVLGKIPPCSKILDQQE